MSLSYLMYQINQINGKKDNKNKNSILHNAWIDGVENRLNLMWNIKYSILINMFDVTNCIMLLLR